jgi:arabinose-5-phosphate isomerase
MGDTLLVMSEKSFGVAAVVADGLLAGVITDGDLRRNMDGLMSRTAGEVATPRPLVTRPDTLLIEALGIMNENRRTSLLVVDEAGRLQGLVHIHDALRAGVA